VLLDVGGSKGDPCERRSLKRYIRPRFRARRSLKPAA